MPIRFHKIGQRARSGLRASVLTPSASLVSRKDWSPKFMQVVGWIQFHGVHELNLSFWETGFNPPTGAGPWGSRAVSGRLVC